MKITLTNVQTLLEYQPILVAVSGGADSMALLGALLHTGVKLVVASFDHQIRMDSHADIEFVREFCQRSDVLFETGTGNALAFAEVNNLSIEESARQLRYKFLFQMAEKHHCGAIATGHTMDDQAETMLMRFIRGAGLAGIKGMLPVTTLEQYSHTIKLVRPILDWRRSDTEAACQAMNITPCVDSTNQDSTYPRNKIRAELMPFLLNYNPSIVETLARNAGILGQQYTYLNEAVRSAFDSSLVLSSQKAIGFSVSSLQLYPDIIIQEIIRSAVFKLSPGIRDVDADTFERFSLINKCDLGGGYHTFVEGDSLWIARTSDDLPNDQHPQISRPILLKVGDNQLFNGWVINYQIIKDIELDQNPINIANDEILIALNGESDQIMLRPPKNGDRLEPFGFQQGSVKCSDLFINNKLPKRYREKYPILEIGKKIVWVPLLRRSKYFPINNKTRLAARIRIFKKLV